MEKDSRLRIDKELGVIEKIVPKVIPTKSDVSHYTSELTGEDDIEDDYKYQRDNFYNLVEKGSAAIDGIRELAKESEHPRTYEVAGLDSFIAFAVKIVMKGTKSTEPPFIQDLRVIALAL